MIVLDASVLIAFLDGHDAHHERAREALLAHVRSSFQASVVTLAEVLVGPARRHEAPRIRSVLAALEIAPVELRAADDLALAQLRASTGLKLPDCCVLLAARSVGARVLSFDERLLRSAGELGLGLGGDELVQSPSAGPTGQRHSAGGS